MKNTKTNNLLKNKFKYNKNPVYIFVTLNLKMSTLEFQKQSIPTVHYLKEEAVFKHVCNGISFLIMI